jgi:hypothetical protein
MAKRIFRLCARFFEGDACAGVKNRLITSLKRAACSEAVREACSVLFVVGLASLMLFPALRGDWPIGHDHPAHLFRIWQLKETILRHGTPWSWSHRWFAGYPQNVVYPVGADFFVLAVQGLSFGMLNVGQAYGVAFWLFYALYGYATFFFIRRSLNSRLTGLIAVVFLLTDPGNNDIGGWFWIVDVGVWAGALGMVPALIGTVKTADLLERPAPRTAAAIGLSIGLALLCHPIHLIYLGIAIPLVCASRYLTEDKTPWREALLLLAAAGLCGLFIASFWMVPYFSATPYLSEVGLSGNRLSKIGTAVATGDLFPRMHPLAMWFGLVGSLALLRARSTLPLFIGIFIFACIALSSSFFVHLFGSETANWLNKHITFPRLLMLAKPFWYGAGAFLIVRSARLVHQTLAARRSPPGEGRRPGKLVANTALIAFVCGGVAPILFFAFRIFIHDEVLRPTQWRSQRRDLVARSAFVAWANTQLPRESGFFRIAHGFDEDEHILTDLGIDVPFPFYKIYLTPTGHFKYNLGGSNTAALRAANVRFILTEHPINRPDFLPAQTFGGQLRLYIFRDWNPNPFEIRQGAGEIRLMEFGDEEIVLRAEPGAHGLLRLNVSYFPKWHATRDGAAVPITATPAPGVDNSAFMQVPLLPGTYRFRYQKDASDYVGSLLCALGAAGVVMLTFWQRGRGVWLHAAD